MNTRLAQTLTRIAAGSLVAAGLIVGASPGTPVAAAGPETSTVSDSASQTREGRTGKQTVSGSKHEPVRTNDTSERRVAPAGSARNPDAPGLNGNPPQQIARQGVDQFGHLPSWYPGTPLGN